MILLTVPFKCKGDYLQMRQYSTSRHQHGQHTIFTLVLKTHFHHCNDVIIIFIYVKADTLPYVVLHFLSACCCCLQDETTDCIKDGMSFDQFLQLNQIILNTGAAILRW